MEHKQFISDALIRSPPINLSFQTDKFTKKINFLSIPDTIHEHISGELSGDSLNMEANDILTKSFDSDEKKNNSEQQVKCNESSDSSEIIAIDNSFIKKCEQKLLDSSNGYEEKSENKNAFIKRLLEIPRKFVKNDSISTPPSALRKEISLLRSELAESDEFHDLEIRLLQEEKPLNDIDLKNYMEVLEKNAELMELYTTLKNEYEEYRKEQEKMRNELQLKTADCLESLCSQIEASDSSLNFSSSFISFSGGIKSSTMMEDISEVEATVLPDVTVLANDPLSITRDGTFKTPMQTPLRSARKLFPHESNTTKTPLAKDVKDVFTKRENPVSLDSEYKIRLLNLETALQDKIREVETLEQRLFKLEDMSGLLGNECERLKENLTKKTDQLNELTQKLFTETISLNPALKDVLTDVAGTKLLVVFIETIMEKCKNIQDELISKHNLEKTEWEIQRKMELTAIENLKEQTKLLNEQVFSKNAKITELEDLKMSLEKQLSSAENTILTRDVELRILQSNIMQIQENFTSSIEASSKLESQLSLIKNEKKELENRCQELEQTIKSLKDELELKYKLLTEHNAAASAVENIQKQNECLKQEIQQSEKIISQLRSELEDKEELAVKFESLKSKEASRFNILFDVLEEYKRNVLKTVESSKPLSENSAFELFSEKINDPQLLRAVEAILNFAKIENETKIENLQSQCKVMREKFSESESKLSKILLDYDELKKLCEDLNIQLNDTKNIISIRDEEIMRLKKLEDQKNSESESKVSEIFTQNDELQKLCEKLTTKLHEAEGIISIRDEEIVSLKKQEDRKSKETESKLTEILTENSEFKELCENLRVKLHEAEKSIATRDEEIMCLKKLEEEKNSECESELSKLSAENVEFKKICENLRTQLLGAEGVISLHEAEINNLRMQENILKQLKEDLGMLDEIETDDLITDKIEKLIIEQPELRTNVEAENSKILSIFIETLTKTCKGVRNKFIKKIESKQNDFETQRNVDLNLIDTLQTEIKILVEKSNQQESKMTEIIIAKEELQKLHNSLTSQMSEAQNIISTRNEEIRVLRTHEATLKQMREELAIADDNILSLKSELTLVESQKVEIETHCRGLEQTVADLTSALESKADLRSDLDDAKSALEKFQNENEKLKHLLEEFEKDSVKSVSQQELLQEIESLKLKGNCTIKALFDISNECKKKLTETESDNGPNFAENTVFGIIYEKLADNADPQLSSAIKAVLDFVKIEWTTKINSCLTQIENLQNQIQTLSEKNNEYSSRLTDIISEKEEFNKLCEDLKNQLREKENHLTLRDQEIAILKKQEDVLNEMKDAIALADETISKLDKQLSIIEVEKKEAENRCQELEQTIINLRNESEQKENRLSELNALASDFTNLLKENEDLKQKNQKSLEEIQSLKTKETSRFSPLFNALEELQNDITNSVSHASELFSKKINDPQLLSAVEAILDFAKAGYESKQKLDLTEIENLQNQIKIFTEKNIESESKLSELLVENSEFSKLCENLKAQLLESEEIISTCNEEMTKLKTQEYKKNSEIESKLSEVLAENNQFKNLCEDLQKQLQEAAENFYVRDEEITSLKRQENVLKKLKGDLELLFESEDSDQLTYKIDKLITNRPELQNYIKTEGTEIVSTFIETVTKTCKGVRNEYIKKIKAKQFEFESQRNIDLNKIDGLRAEIKILTEKSNEQESKIKEICFAKEDLQKLHSNLTNEMKEAQNIISTCNEEIRVLRTHEATLKRSKEELAAANDIILTLKSQLASTESQKVEIELRYRKLEESTVSLQTEIDTKETIIKGLDELKFIREKMENENGELKQQILQSEDVIHELKKGLEAAVEDQKSKELRIKSLLSQVTELEKNKEDLLSKEKETLTEFSRKLEELEKTNKNFMDVFSDVQSHLDLPEDTMRKLLSGNFDDRKIITEKMNNLVKTQTEGLQAENKSLKLGNENLKEKVKQLSKLLCESAGGDIKDLNVSQNHPTTLRSRSSKNMDLCVRRLDKLEDINHNLTELLTRVLTMTSFPDVEKLKLCSVRDFPNITKKVVAHISDYESKMKEMKEENAQLDEECEIYSNIIKDLKKEAAAVWRSNKEKTDEMEAEISKLKDEKNLWENERQDLMSKISKLETECQKLKSTNRAVGPLHSCTCGNESKKINELKRTLLIREQKLLELQDLEVQINSHKSQTEYLRTALEKEKRKVNEEKEKNKKLQIELNEAMKNQKFEKQKDERNEMLDELRMRGSISGGVVQEFVDKEKMRKLSKDIGILKELCRARYAEIKRLEAVNASLRNNIPKNSNQMDSPIRSRGYNTRSKNPIRGVWKSEISGKENSSS